MILLPERQSVNRNEPSRLYRRHAEWVEPQALAAPASRDPDDDWVLATAIAGRAEAIVTGDGNLLELRSYQGVALLTPRQLIEQITRTPRS